jgi:hypothetical protein
MTYRHTQVGTVIIGHFDFSAPPGNMLEATNA